LDRRMAKSIASLEFAGSAIEDVRRRCGDIGVVGERSPVLLDCCSKSAVT
jgi:hypothetical protein